MSATPPPDHRGSVNSQGPPQLPILQTNNFGRYTTPYPPVDPTLSSPISPISILGQLEEYGPDFAPSSLGSPISPVHSPSIPTSPFGYATGAEYAPWGTAERRLSQQTPSPAINPMDLTLPAGAYAFESQGFMLNQGTPMMVQPSPIIMSSQPAQPAQATRQLPSPVESTVPASKQPVEYRWSSTASRGRSTSSKGKRKASESASEVKERSAKRRSSSPVIIKVDYDAEDEKVLPPSRRGSEQHVAHAESARKSHNEIERRYRINLNDKIAVLCDAVPILRQARHRLGHSPPRQDPEEEDRDDRYIDPLVDDGSIDPVIRLNKATVLSRAAQYIGQLERRNRALIAENNALHGRVEGFEAMVLHGGVAAGASYLRRRRN